MKKVYGSAAEALDGLLRALTSVGVTSLVCQPPTLEELQQREEGSSPFPQGRTGRRQCGGSPAQGPGRQTRNNVGPGSPWEEVTRQVTGPGRQARGYVGPGSPQTQQAGQQFTVSHASLDPFRHHFHQLAPRRVLDQPHCRFDLRQ